MVNHRISKRTMTGIPPGRQGRGRSKQLEERNNAGNEHKRSAGMRI